MTKAFYMPFFENRSQSLKTDHDIRVAFVQLESHRDFTSVSLFTISNFIRQVGHARLKEVLYPSFLYQEIT